MGQGIRQRRDGPLCLCLHLFLVSFMYVREHVRAR